jgi:hypothetical protein
VRLNATQFPEPAALTLVHHSGHKPQLRSRQTWLCFRVLGEKRPLAFGIAKAASCFGFWGRPLDFEDWVGLGGGGGFAEGVALGSAGGELGFGGVAVQLCEHSADHASVYGADDGVRR